MDFNGALSWLLRNASNVTQGSNTSSHFTERGLIQCPRPVGYADFEKSACFVYEKTTCQSSYVLILHKIKAWQGGCTKEKSPFIHIALWMLDYGEAKENSRLDMHYLLGAHKLVIRIIIRTASCLRTTV